jgi:hypothetical protein
MPHHRAPDRSLRKIHLGELEHPLPAGSCLATRRPEESMAEVLVDYTELVARPDGTRYAARACGAETENGTWHGWLEFVDPAGGETIRSGRETTQPNRTDTLYWATGLSAVYLEGALERALHPLARPATRTAGGPFEPPMDPTPRPPDQHSAAPESILNPFSVYRKGETLLRRQLGALSAWHLVNIARAHELAPEAAEPGLEALTADELIDIIVEGVKRGTGDARS